MFNCYQNKLTSYQQIIMKFLGNVYNRPRNTFSFSDVLDSVRIMTFDHPKIKVKGFLQSQILCKSAFLVFFYNVQKICSKKFFLSVFFKFFSF